MIAPAFAGGLIMFAGGVFSIRAADRTDQVGTNPVDDSRSQVSPGIDHVSVEGAGLGLLGLVLMLAATAL